MRTVNLFLLLGSFLNISVAHGKASETFANFSERASSLIKKYKISEDDLGLIISAGEGPDAYKVFELNSKKKMIPASISKVVTASAVLGTFPPGTKLKTQLYMDGRVINNKLEGNLILKGGGDPGFVSENMWYLVNAFTREQVKTISGDIIVDDSLFDKKRFDDSRQEQRVDRAYDAPVGAMSFNWNSVNVFVRPASQAGESASVFIDPENEYIQLVNKSKTNSGAGNSLFVDRDMIPKQPGDRVTVGGSIGVKSKEVTVFKNITEPDIWSGYNLKSFLSQRGISVQGKIRNGQLPKQAKLVAEAESKPIEHMVADMNKFSNNYVAEMLTKNIVAKEGAEPATLKAGVQKINEHLKELGIPKEEIEFLNPSGLTRDNRLTANAVWMVLQHLKNDFRVQPEFLTSLPIAGVDGTLKRRMKNTNGERWVRAKTGYLTNVITLAGYAGRDDGQVLTFTFIFNGKTDEGKVRQFFDDLLVALVEH